MPYRRPQIRMIKKAGQTEEFEQNRTMQAGDVDRGCCQQDKSPFTISRYVVNRCCPRTAYACKRRRLMDYLRLLSPEQQTRRCVCCLNSLLASAVLFQQTLRESRCDAERARRVSFKFVGKANEAKVIKGGSREASRAF